MFHHGSYHSEWPSSKLTHHLRWNRTRAIDMAALRFQSQWNWFWLACFFLVAFKLFLSLMSCPDSFGWFEKVLVLLQTTSHHCSDLLGLSFQVSKPLINSQSFVVGGSFCDLFMGHGTSQVIDPRALPDGCAQDPAGLDEGDASDPAVCSRRFKRRRVLNTLLKEYHDLSLPVPDEVTQLALEVFSNTLCDQMPKRKFEFRMFPSQKSAQGTQGLTICSQAVWVFWLWQWSTCNSYRIICCFFFSFGKFAATALMVKSLREQLIALLVTCV